jgi:Trk K+ transport system NAD-binding subunit
LRRKRLKQTEQGLGWRLGYRLDRFLSLHPATQLFFVLLAACFLTALFALAIHLADDSAPEARVRGFWPSMWWALTRMLDGGTVYNDTEAGVLRRLLGVSVTVFGLAAVAIVTGSFASSFSDRLRSLRAGTLPVFEHDHILVLGYNAHAGVVLRELATSGAAITIVIVADLDRDLVEESIREHLAGVAHRLVIIVRRGDPTTTATARRGAARKARAIVIVPSADAPSAADRAVLRALLAVRRVVARRRVPTLVEVSSAAGRDLLKLAAGDDQAIVLDARDVSARILAHAVRQKGVFDVARQILSLDKRSIYVHAPKGLTGKTFDEAHEALEGGVLIGLVRDGLPVLSPPGATVISPADRLLFFSDHAALPSAHGKLPDASAFLPPKDLATSREIRVIAIRHRPELGEVLEILSSSFSVACTTLVDPTHAGAARGCLSHAAHQKGVTLEVIEGDPLDQTRIAEALARPHDVVLLLAPDTAPMNAEAADADQLITLLQVRNVKRGPRDQRDRVVVEVRSPETAKLGAALASPDDFLVSRELVGMLLAQELHGLCEGRNDRDAWAGPFFDALLDAIGPSVELRPLDVYAKARHITFGELSARARKMGETAIGIRRSGERAVLLPRRDMRIDLLPSIRLVVLRGVPPTSHSLAPKAILDAASSTSPT